MKTSLKNLAGQGLIKSNENHYPADDAVIAADVILPAQEKVTWIAFKSAAQRKRLCSANKVPCIDRRGAYMINASQEPTLHNFGTGFSFTL
jgi:hypothetical protein